MIVHWNAKGVADGYAGKFLGLAAIPLMTLAFYAFFSFLPRIAVFGKNLEKFKLQYVGFKLVFTVFMCVIYIATVLVNLGRDVNIPAIVMASMVVLFYYIGWMLKYCKRNYFIGIRTPWTLASENVWDRTHALGGLVFRKMAILLLVCLVLPPEFAFIVLMVAILSATLLLVGYSYILWAKEQKGMRGNRVGKPS